MSGGTDIKMENEMKATCDFCPATAHGTRDELYIKMCEKAVEIQDNYRSMLPAADDIFLGKIYSGTVLFIQLTPTNTPITDYYIWLPRLGQLFWMIPEWDKSTLIINKMSQIVDWGSVDCHSAVYSDSFHTIEALVLAFVMDIKFGKVWNGSDWIKKVE
jgi:hypothetical protein